MIESIVQRCIKTAPRQCRSRFRPFACVVIDHVQKHLDVGLMQDRHHASELINHTLSAAPACSLGSVRRFRGKERQRRITPIIRQPAFNQERLIVFGVDGQQFHSRDAQLLQIVHRCGVRQSCVSSPQVIRNVRHIEREALDVQLIDHGLVPRCARFVGNVELRGHDNRVRHVGC